MLVGLLQVVVHIARFQRTPAVTLLPPSILPRDNHKARFVSLCMCFRSTICWAQKMYSIFSAN